MHDDLHLEKAPAETIPPESGSDLVRRACAHDPEAWQEIVRRYRGMVGKVARSYRLSDADTADVMQNTWLRAFERLETVREPDRLSGWLATTARRECLGGPAPDCLGGTGRGASRPR